MEVPSGVVARPFSPDSRHQEIDACFVSQNVSIATKSRPLGSGLGMSQNDPTETLGIKTKGEDCCVRQPAIALLCAHSTCPVAAGRVLCQYPCWQFNQQETPMQLLKVFGILAVVVCGIAFGSITAQTEAPKPEFAIEAQSNSGTAWVLNTTTGQVRICLPPPGAQAPECGAWSN